jgi:hypothetical protein
VTFKPGESGNPNGRSAGSRNKASLAVEALLEGEAQALGRKAIEVALTGDVQALRLCLDRIAPLRRARVSVELPELHSAADLPAALAALVKLIGDGALAPDEGAAIGAVLEQQRRAIELVEIDERLRAIEERMR